MTKEEEILIIAEDEFFRNGYLNTSMVTVAKRAGVTHAMVNYYFRSKEQLFLRILDTHTFSFIENLKSVMKEDGDFIQTLVNAATITFDTLNSDKAFPFLIQDVARDVPELLERYRKPVGEFFTELIGRHSTRLDEQISAGAVVPTTMKELLESLGQMVVSPFLLIPALENVLGFDKNETESFLARRRAELETQIRALYASHLQD